MAKQFISPPRTREVGPPPEALKSQRSGGVHEHRWLSRITIERQRTDVNPLAAKVGGFHVERDGGMVRRIITGRAKR